MTDMLFLLEGLQGRRSALQNHGDRNATRLLLAWR